MTAAFYDDDYDGEYEQERQEYAFELWKADREDRLANAINERTEK